MDKDGYNDLRLEYERGFIDGMQKQMQSSVDRTVNAMAKREWVGLTYEEHHELADKAGCMSADWVDFARAIEAKLKEKNT